MDYLSSMQEAISAAPTAVQQDLIDRYISILDNHIAELKAGTAEKTLEINDFAAMLFVHPRHLSNTIHNALGTSPCDLYEDRLLAISKELLASSPDSIAAVARHLMYDPSNFSKFFKTYTGITPGQYRKQIAS